MTEALYLYGFLALDAPAPPEELTGIEERPVELLDLDGFRAVVSRLASTFHEEAEGRGDLRDLKWMAARGVQHERVVTWFVDRGGILPAPLLTLYSSRAALEQEADERASLIRNLLERVAPLHEWNLKVSYDRDRFDPRLGEYSADIRALDREIAAATPGRRYLLEQRRIQQEHMIIGEVVETMARDLLDGIGEVAIRKRTLPHAGEGDRGSVVFGAALLVNPSDSETLRSQLEAVSNKWEGEGVHLSYSGPWAPYRFLEAHEPS